MYSSRLAKILLICIDSNEYITYQTISEKLQISTRTIMRELQNINTSLLKHNVEIHFKKGKGIKLIGTDDKLEALKIYLEGTKVDFTSKEERQELLCLELLNTPKIQKIAYYATLFDVSQATISHDLDDLMPFFKEYHLSLIRRPGYGIGIEGKEHNVRNALSILINKSIGHHLEQVDFDRYNIQDILQQLFASKESNMAKLLNQDILIEILEELKDNQETIDLQYMAKNSYIGLLIHLMIAIKRITLGEEIASYPKLEELQYDVESYTIASKIIACLSKRFDIIFPQSEYVFITIHLDSAKRTLVTQTQGEEDELYLPLIERMIDVFDTYGYDLKGDIELYQGLIVHLKPALVRLQFGLPIYNPMLAKIKKDYLTIFTITKQACEEVTKLYDYSINEDEIGYLSLHFGAAIERKKQIAKGNQEVIVGIVCSSGIGMSALLMARLRQIVDTNVQLIPLSIQQINSVKCDVLLSTFVIAHVDAIIISPLLSNKDIHMIQRKISEKRKEENALVVREDAILTMPNILSTIQAIANSIQLYRYDSTMSKTKVIETISKEITKHYDALITSLEEREKKSSNVYHSFHFALFHTITDVVNHCVIKVIQPQDLIFSDTSLANTKVILVMLMPESPNKEQQSVMSYISTMLLEEDEFFKTLCTGTQNDIVKQFDTLLKNYVNLKVKELQ